MRLRLSHSEGLAGKGLRKRDGQIGPVNFLPPRRQSKIIKGLERVNDFNQLFQLMQMQFYAYPRLGFSFG